ncbi:MAG: hypothetical protein IBJ11_04830 [Phycisphaerales bacterium]|nr:hypothetical protein [Phycisphaerales bacterium]
MKTRCISAGIACIAAVAVGAVAQADVVITFTEDVSLSTTTIRAVGSLDTSPFTSSQYFEGLGSGAFVRASWGWVNIGPMFRPRIQYFFPAGTIPTLGASGSFASGSFLGPDVFGIAAFQSTSPGDPARVVLAADYASGSMFNAAAVYGGTFATLGIVPGAYVATLPGDQSLTYQFITIPAPGAAAMLAFGGVLAARRRR